MNKVGKVASSRNRGKFFVGLVFVSIGVIGALGLALFYTLESSNDSTVVSVLPDADTTDNQANDSSASGFLANLQSQISDDDSQLYLEVGDEIIVKYKFWVANNSCLGRQTDPNLTCYEGIVNSTVDLLSCNFQYMDMDYIPKFVCQIIEDFTLDYNYNYDNAVGEALDNINKARDLHERLVKSEGSFVLNRRVGVDGIYILSSDSEGGEATISYITTVGLGNLESDIGGFLDKFVDSLLYEYPHPLVLHIDETSGEYTLFHHFHIPPDNCLDIIGTCLDVVVNGENSLIDCDKWGNNCLVDSSFDYVSSIYARGEIHRKAVGAAQFSIDIARSLDKQFSDIFAELGSKNGFQIRKSGDRYIVSYHYVSDIDESRPHDWLLCGTNYRQPPYPSVATCRRIDY